MTCRAHSELAHSSSATAHCRRPGVVPSDERPYLFQNGLRPLHRSIIAAGGVDDALAAARRTEWGLRRAGFKRLLRACTDARRVWSRMTDGSVAVTFTRLMGDLGRPVLKEGGEA